MILVTLGTQKFQMNRLVEAADKIAPKITEDIFIQTGHSTYKPINCKYSTFVDTDEFNKMIQDCSIMVSHSGVGSIMTALKAGKPVIVVPRLEEYKEHVDNHQRDIAEAFASKGCVLYCKDVNKLSDYIEQARKYDFQPYIVHGGNIEDIIISFINTVDSKPLYQKV